MSDEMTRDLGRVIEAVAALDTFYDEDYGVAYCPFDCGWDVSEGGRHSEDCPITLARGIKSANASL